jgi:hypothetical protein
VPTQPKPVGEAIGGTDCVGQHRWRFANNVLNPLQAAFGAFGLGDAHASADSVLVQRPLTSPAITPDRLFRGRPERYAAFGAVLLAELG